MDTVQTIASFDPIKIIADPLRLKILRLLMAEAATLSQLGRTLKIHPAKVRYHLKQLEELGLVELVSTREVGGFVEKYYRATSRALLVNLAITPQSKHGDIVLALGSHDLALELLAETLSQEENTPDMFALPLGSLDGLIALRQGTGQMAGCHLLDPPSGEYNLPYVRHLFPGREMRVITLVRRQQGLLVARGNPLRIQGLDDLVRDDLRFVNRKRGSGTRLWLDQQVRERDIPISEISGYDWTVNTHVQVAEAVAKGQADLGLAVLAAAQRFEHGFLPLFEERYDLVIPEEHYQSPLLVPALECIHTAKFRRAVETLGGYNTAEAGKEVVV